MVFGEEININRHLWLYFERRGLCVVKEVLHDSGELNASAHAQVFYLSWPRLCSLVDSYRRAKSKRSGASRRTTHAGTPRRSRRARA